MLSRPRIKMYAPPNIPTILFKGFVVSVPIETKIANIATKTASAAVTKRILAADPMPYNRSVVSPTRSAGVESTPPSNFVAEHVLQEMHRRHPEDTFWFVLTKPRDT